MSRLDFFTLPQGPYSISRLHIFHYRPNSVEGDRKGNIQLQSKQACLVDMFVIQLMHYLEAAGCGTRQFNWP